MNRQQRRAVTRDKSAVFVELPAGSPFDAGERFTIAGVRIELDGTIVDGCAPGAETWLTAAPAGSVGVLRIDARGLRR